MKLKRINLIHDTMYKLKCIVCTGVFIPQVFVGLGFPYEGPAPLEAIANGAVYINPKFSSPHSSKNTQFFKGKPTAREVRLQPKSLLSLNILFRNNISTPDRDFLKKIP